MGIGSGLQELGAFLDDCERRAEAVERVDVDRVHRAGDSGVTAAVTVTLSATRRPSDGVTFADPHVDSDGSVRFALDSTAELFPVADHDVGVDVTEAEVDAAGAMTIRLTASVPAGDAGERASLRQHAATDEPVSRSTTAESSGQSATAAESSAQSARSATVEAATEASAVGHGDDATDRDHRDEPETGTRDRDVPPFKDPDLLAEVYESCDTFAEMAETLEMDVTAETVRRYMIDYDIHEPNSYQTGSDAASASNSGEEDQPVVLSDGIGLPEDVTVDELVETVRRSNTIYEVKQDIDVDRDDALEMLQDLNLLDIVMGRLATEGERNFTREDVIDRLREASAVQ